MATTARVRTITTTTTMTRAATIQAISMAIITTDTTLASVDCFSLS